MSAQLRWLGLVVAFGLGVAGCVGGGTTPGKSFGSAPKSGNGSSGMSGSAVTAGSAAPGQTGAAAGSGAIASGQSGAGGSATGNAGSAMSGQAGSGMTAGGQAGATMANAGRSASAGTGAAAGTSAAGGGSGGAGAPAPLTAGARDSHFPLVDGSSWVYHHTKPATAAWDETDTARATTYMGKAAILFEDQEDAQGVQTHSTLLDDGTGVYRAYKENTIKGQTVLTVTYNPAFLRFDESWTQMGQMVTLTDNWTQNCVLGGTAVSNCTTGSTKNGMTTHVFTVVSPSAQVTVPAGTFDTVEIQRVDPSTQETKLFWFAAGVGKVREEVPATMAVTELTSFHIP